MKRFVVLDRDGTIVVEKNYLSNPEDIELTVGAAQGLRRLAAMGLGLVVVTNQSAVGRGWIDPARLEAIHGALSEKLASEGVALDGIYVCPHTPEDGCACRKPETGLLERAAREHGFDPAESFVIGDKSCDMELGRRAGSTTILVATGYGPETALDPTVPVDHFVQNLPEAAALLETLLAEPQASEHGSIRSRT